MCSCRCPVCCWFIAFVCGSTRFLGLLLLLLILLLLLLLLLLAEATGKALASPWSLWFVINMSLWRRRQRQRTSIANDLDPQPLADWIGLIGNVYLLLLETDVGHAVPHANRKRPPIVQQALVMANGCWQMRCFPSAAVSSRDSCCICLFCFLWFLLLLICCEFGTGQHNALSFTSKINNSNWNCNCNAIMH